MQVGLSKDKNPTDIEFTRLKVKVTSVFFVKKWFLLIILRPVFSGLSYFMAGPLLILC